MTSKFFLICPVTIFSPHLYLLAHLHPKLHLSLNTNSFLNQSSSPLNFPAFSYVMSPLPRMPSAEMLNNNKLLNKWISKWVNDHIYLNFLGHFEKGHVPIQGNKWDIYLGKLEDSYMVGFQGIIKSSLLLAYHWILSHECFISLSKGLVLLEVSEGGRSAEKEIRGQRGKLQVGGSWWETANSTSLPRTDVMMALEQKSQSKI